MGEPAGDLRKLWKPSLAAPLPESLSAPLKSLTEEVQWVYYASIQTERRLQDTKQRLREAGQAVALLEAARQEQRQQISVLEQELLDQQQELQQVQRRNVELEESLRHQGEEHRQALQEIEELRQRLTVQPGCQGQAVEGTAAQPSRPGEQAAVPSQPSPQQQQQDSAAAQPGRQTQQAAGPSQPAWLQQPGRAAAAAAGGELRIVACAQPPHVPVTQASTAAPLPAAPPSGGLASLWGDSDGEEEDGIIEKLSIVRVRPLLLSRHQGPSSVAARMFVSSARLHAEPERDVSPWRLDCGPCLDSSQPAQVALAPPAERNRAQSVPEPRGLVSHGCASSQYAQLGGDASPGSPTGACLPPCEGKDSPSVSSRETSLACDDRAASSPAAPSHQPGGVVQQQQQQQQAERGAACLGREAHADPDMGSGASAAAARTLINPESGRTLTHVWNVTCSLPGSHETGDAQGAPPAEPPPPQAPGCGLAREGSGGKTRRFWAERVLGTYKRQRVVDKGRGAADRPGEPPGGPGGRLEESGDNPGDGDSSNGRAEPAWVGPPPVATPPVEDEWQGPQQDAAASGGAAAGRPKRRMPPKQQVPSKTERGTKSKRKSRFTKEEIRKFAQVVSKHGLDLDRLQVALPGRSDATLRKFHASNKFRLDYSRKTKNGLKQKQKQEQFHQQTQWLQLQLQQRQDQEQMGVGPLPAVPGMRGWQPSMLVAEGQNHGAGE